MASGMKRSSFSNGRRRRLVVVDQAEPSSVAVNVEHNVDVFNDMFGGDRLDAGCVFRGFRPESLMWAQEHLERINEQERELIQQRGEEEDGQREQQHHQEIEDQQCVVVKESEDVEELEQSEGRVCRRGSKRRFVEKDSDVELIEHVDSGKKRSRVAKSFLSTKSPVPEVPEAIKCYADSISKKGSNEEGDHKIQKKIRRILASQWETRLRKVENKYVKTTTRSSPTSCLQISVGATTSATPSASSTKTSSVPKPFALTKPKLELNEYENLPHSVSALTTSSTQTTPTCSGVTSSIATRSQKKIDRGDCSESTLSHSRATLRVSDERSSKQRNMDVGRQEVPLSRPLFDSFSLDSSHSASETLTKRAIGLEDGNLKNKSEQVILCTNKNIKSSTRKNSRKKSKARNVVMERLLNGWTKKAVQRLTGETLGKWDVYLITPDQKLLRSQTDLKLYIAKSGAIVDFNIVNFALPKNTAFKSLDSRSDEKKKDLAPEEILQRKSRRECRLPFKLRAEDEEEKRQQLKSMKNATTVFATPKAKGDDLSEQTSLHSNNMTDITDACIVAKKSPPCDSHRHDGAQTIGVGTFSLELTHTSPSTDGSPTFPSFCKPVSELMVSCNACSNCRKEKCMKCMYCRYNKSDQVTSKTCIYKKCLNPRLISESSKCELPKSSPEVIVATKSRPDTEESRQRRNSEQKQGFRNEQIYGSELNEESYEVEEGSFCGFEYTLDAFQFDVEAREAEKSKGDLNVQSETSESHASDERTNLTTKLPGDSSNIDEKKEENEVHKRPENSMASIICITLQSLPDQKGTYGDIIDFVAKKWPYFAHKKDPSGWHNSVRHNLSLRNEFVRSKSEKVGKQSVWSLNPDADLKSLALRSRINGTKIQETETAIIDTSVSSSFDDTPTTTTTMEGDKEISTPDCSQEKTLNVLETNEGAEPEDKGDDIGPNSHESEVTRGEIECKEVVNSSDSLTDTLKETKLTTSNQVLVISRLPTTITEGLLCSSCGSYEASADDLLTCVSCCQRFHPFCVNSEDLNVFDPVNNMWMCPKCIPCAVCGISQGSGAAMKRCHSCHGVFHSTCIIVGDCKTLKDESGRIQPWICRGCLKCFSCQSSNVSHVVSEGKLVCSSCCLLLKEGNFCPLCTKCYDDDDFETRMIECAACGAWVHADCENVDAEQYQVLSILPDDVEYVCRCGHVGLRGVVAVPVTSFSEVAKDDDENNKEEQSNILSLKSANQVMPELPKVPATFLEQD